MTRYLIDTPAKLALVAVAFDQANGLRDAAGKSTPRQCRIFRGGVEVTGTVYDPATWGAPVYTTDTLAPPIVGDDDTAALELPVTAEVDAHFGKTVNGVAMPTKSSCVVVARPAENSKLPDGVMRELDARYVAGKSDVEAMAELGPARAASARQREQAKASQRVLEQAMGLGE